MKMLRMSGPTGRTAALLGFVFACVVFAGYLYVQAGGRLPIVGSFGQYQVSFDVPDVGNLVTFADVQQAGVPVGKVAALNRVGSDAVRIVLALDPVATPIHQGATVQIGEKSLAGQPEVELVDGIGPAYQDGSVLPASAVKPAVTLRDVLASLDQPTRQALRGVVRSFDEGVDGRAHDVSGIAAGLADIGNNGDTALDALAAQSDDLEQISQQLSQIFDALDTGQGQIMQLVSSGNRLSRATAGQRPALEASLRKLPGLLDNTTAASADISRLAQAFAPVAADLRQAAPDLNDALGKLPPTSSDLRHLLPTLNTVLDDAPDTLNRVPNFGKDARDVFPAGVSVLRDLNPTLRYLKPYGLDIATFFTNFGDAIHHYADDGGSSLYVRPIVSPGAIKMNPVKLPRVLLDKNPFPAPGGMRDLKPFSGAYPRLERDGN